MSENCIFCKIIKGELEASIVYQDELVTAFMDLAPLNPGHTLVIPNVHSKSFAGIPQENVAQMFVVAQRIVKAFAKSDIKCEGTNIFLSDGEVAGQEVMHSHLHLAPRFQGDGKRAGFLGQYGGMCERSILDTVALNIKENL